MPIDDVVAGYQDRVALFDFMSSPGSDNSGKGVKKQNETWCVTAKQSKRELNGVQKHCLHDAMQFANITWRIEGQLSWLS